MVSSGVMSALTGLEEARSFVTGLWQWDRMISPPLPEL